MNRIDGFMNDDSIIDLTIGDRTNDKPMIG
jgi:hypothetical protein